MACPAAAAAAVDDRSASVVCHFAVDFVVAVSAGLAVAPVVGELVAAIAVGWLFAAAAVGQSFAVVGLVVAVFVVVQREAPMEEELCIRLP